MDDGERAVALAEAARLLQGALVLCDRHEIGLIAAPYIDLALTKLVTEQASIDASN